MLEVEVEGIANGLIPVTPTPAPNFIPVANPDAAREDVNVDEDAGFKVEVEVEGVSSPHLSDELLFSFFNNREPDPAFEVVIVGILPDELLVGVVEDEGNGSEGRLGWVDGPKGL